MIRISEGNESLSSRFDGQFSHRSEATTGHHNDLKGPHCGKGRSKLTGAVVSSSGEILFFDDGDQPNAAEVSRFMRIRVDNKAANHPTSIDKEVETSSAYYNEQQCCTICDQLFRRSKWNLKRPSLIIVVTGGEEIEMGNNPDVVAALRTGIVEAAQSAKKAWIVSNGLNKGLMKLIGDEVGRLRRIGKYDITCIGVGPWSRLNNTYSRLGDAQAIERNPEIVKCAIDNIMHQDYATLNSGYNYYLLIDSDKEKLREVANNFCVILMHHIAKESHNKKLGDYTPVVMLVLGHNTKETLSKCFTGNHTNPAVIVKGFSGASAVMADAYTYLSDKRDNIESFAYLKDKEIKNEKDLDELGKAIYNNDNLSQMISDADYATKNDKIRNKLELELAREIHDDVLTAWYKGLLTVVDATESPTSVRDAILEAIFKAYKDDSITKNPRRFYYLLKLAQDWSQYKKATVILEKYRAAERKNKNIEWASTKQHLENFRRLLRRAIISGKPEFFQLILNFNLVSMNDFIRTANDVQKIYKKTLNYKPASKTAELLNKAVKNLEMFKSLDSLRELKAVGEIMAEQIHCFLNGLCDFPGYTYKESRENNCGKKALTNLEYANTTQSEQSDERETVDPEAYVNEQQLPFLVTNYRDVFLLQLAMNHTELADYFWEKGRDLLGTALIASILLKELSSMAKKKNVYELSKAYMDRASVWENRARSILDECNSSHPGKVKWLLTRNLRTWQNKSVFDIAYYGSCKHFVEHSVVQVKLKHIWHGRIIAYHRSVWIYLAALLPLPLIFFLTFAPRDFSGKKRSYSNESCLPHKQNQVVPIEATKDSSSSEGFFELKPTLSLKRCGCLLFPNRYYCHSTTKEAICVTEAIKLLYTSTMVKYFWHLLFKLAFLVNFSAFILTGTLEPEVTVQECIVLAWSACHVVDIFHEAYGEAIMITHRLGADKFGVKLGKRTKIFFSSAIVDKLFNWEKFDPFDTLIPFIGTSSLIFALVTRLYLPPHQFIYPRSAYSIACFMFWLRDSRIFYLLHDLGLIVVIMVELLPTLFYFLMFYAFLLITFSIPIYSLMSPASTYRNGTSDIFGRNYTFDASYNKYQSYTQFSKLFAKVVYNRWWNLVQVGMDGARENVEGLCTVDSSPTYPSLPLQIDGSSDQEFNIIAVILYVIYVLMTNIAWMNILIASLTQKIDQMKDMARIIAKYNYLTIVRLYHSKCRFPPPINVLEIIYRMLRLCLAQEQPDDTKLKYFRFSDFLEFYSEDTHIVLDEIERNAATKILADKKEN